MEEENPGSPIDGEKLDLEFPCPWAYTVFGKDEALLKSAIAEIVGQAEHSLEFGHASSSGKYRSMHLVVTVIDESHRLTIFKELHAHAHVVYVL